MKCIVLDEVIHVLVHNTILNFENNFKCCATTQYCRICSKYQTNQYGRRDRWMQSLQRSRRPLFSSLGQPLPARSPNGFLALSIQKDRKIGKRERRKRRRDNEKDVMMKEIMWQISKILPNYLKKHRNLEIKTALLVCWYWSA